MNTLTTAPDSSKLNNPEITYKDDDRKNSDCLLIDPQEQYSIPKGSQNINNGQTVRSIEPINPAIDYFSNQLDALLFYLQSQELYDIYNTLSPQERIKDTYLLASYMADSLQEKHPEFPLSFLIIESLSQELECLMGDIDKTNPLQALGKLREIEQKEKKAEEYSNIANKYHEFYEIVRGMNLNEAVANQYNSVARPKGQEEKEESDSFIRHLDAMLPSSAKKIQNKITAIIKAINPKI